MVFPTNHDQYWVGEGVPPFMDTFSSAMEINGCFPAHYVRILKRAKKRQGPGNQRYDGGWQSELR